MKFAIQAEGGGEGGGVKGPRSNSVDSMPKQLAKKKQAQRNESQRRHKYVALLVGLSDVVSDKGQKGGNEVQHDTRDSVKTARLKGAVRNSAQQEERCKGQRKEDSKVSATQGTVQQGATQGRGQGVGQGIMQGNIMFNAMYNMRVTRISLTANQSH